MHQANFQPLSADRRKQIADEVIRIAAEVAAFGIITDRVTGDIEAKLGTNGRTRLMFAMKHLFTLVSKEHYEAFLHHMKVKYTGDIDLPSYKLERDDFNPAHARAILRPSKKVFTLADLFCGLHDALLECESGQHEDQSATHAGNAHLKEWTGQAMAV